MILYMSVYKLYRISVLCMYMRKGTTSCEYIYTYICLYIHTHEKACTIHVYTHTSTNVHTCTHALTHTHTLKIHNLFIFIEINEFMHRYTVQLICSTHEIGRVIHPRRSTAYEINYINTPWPPHSLICSPTTASPWNHG